MRGSSRGGRDETNLSSAAAAETAHVPTLGHDERRHDRSSVRYSASADPPAACRVGARCCYSPYTIRASLQSRGGGGGGSAVHRDPKITANTQRVTSAYRHRGTDRRAAPPRYCNEYSKFRPPLALSIIRPLNDVHRLT